MRRRYTLFNSGFTKIFQLPPQEAVTALVDPAIDSAVALVHILYPGAQLQVRLLHEIRALPEQFLVQYAIYRSFDPEAELQQADAVVMLHYSEFNSPPSWRLNIDFLNLGKTSSGKIKYLALHSDNRQKLPFLYLQVYHIPVTDHNRLITGLNQAFGAKTNVIKRENVPLIT
jgi:hypothetical protein